VAASLAASSLQALPPTGTISASATLSDVQVGSTYDYTLTLQNTGSLGIESFWYGWTTSGNNLPSNPTTPGNSLGWANTLDGNSIKFTGNSSDALAPNSSATFTFDSTSTPAQMTAGAAGESVAYVGPIDFTQNSPGDSSAVFAPTAVPEPSTLGLLAIGMAGWSAAAWRKSRGK
jgi:PEP-CTERM motif